MKPTLTTSGRAALLSAFGALGGALVGGLGVALGGPWVTVPLVLVFAGGVAWVRWSLSEDYLDRVRAVGARAVREAGLSEHKVVGDEVRVLEAGLNALILALARDKRHLKRQRTLEEAIMRSSLGGLVVTGRKGLIRAVNPAARELLPMVKDPLGKRPIEAIPFAPLARALEDAVELGEPVEREAASGRFDLVIRAVPLGEDGGAIAVIVDITSARRAERARSDFVANVSHELRTPITSIVGYAETLLADPQSLDPLLVEMLEPIHRNATRLSRIFEDLLQLSRIEARQEDLPLDSCPLRELIDEVVDGLRPAAQARQITVSVEDPQELSARVHREAFHHMLGNLVDNAIKYTPEGGRVRILTHREGQEVRVDVDDNGPGIDPVHHARIFERFYRVDPGRSRAAGGTGLGLAIVKHLGRATGARVTLRSLPGRGTTFSLHLPA